ncbi:hypothetical protein BDN71DRAFT_917198 [Pleurotus eryngii]|uniref:Uncharacterized protein n=1 Tax=Pleurotus eryngii TaxID=5323 RepID=A0A9P5ZWA4_PLEER|nr:hypothetical protein BDN71DRAFT_917198 [Pleurotus eryngii]
MSNPNRPNLPDRIIWLERAVLVGDCVSQMLYGILFLVFAQIMYTLAIRPRQSGPRKWPLIAYTILLFVLCSVYNCMNLNSLRLMFVDNRMKPGGPTAYALSEYGKAVTVIPNACAIVGDWLAAGFLLYRCMVIFHMKFYIVAVPILMYLGSVATGCLVLYRSSRPGAHLWTKTTVDFGVPYFSLSVALNVLITMMISIRLLMFRHSLRKVLGPQAMSVPYASIAAMLIESSALYAGISLIFIGGYGAKSVVSNMFLPNMVMAQFLAPMLIILRVAQRRAWDSKTATTAPMTALNFNKGSPGAHHHAHTHTDYTEDQNEKFDSLPNVQLKFKQSDGSYGDSTTQFTNSTRTQA